MAAQTWTTLQTTLLAALVKSQPPYTVVPPDFAVLFPQATSYAEGRIYGDGVFLSQRTVNTSLATVAGSRTIDVSSLSPALLVPEGFALITPGGQNNPRFGTRVPFDMADLDVIDEIWPVEAAVVAPNIADWSPRFWGMLDAQTIVYCPTADAAYTVALTGLIQPAPLSATNPTTYLLNTYPELFEAACMVFLTGWLLHNYGSQSDQPQSAMSYEQQYQALMTNARQEEQRRRGLAPPVSPSSSQPQGA